MQTRRDFLKNVSLAAASAGALSMLTGGCGTNLTPKSAKQKPNIPTFLQSTVIPTSIIVKVNTPVP